MVEEQLNFKNVKQRGEWVEMLFMARAAQQGFQVSKPYGDSAAYDFIVETSALCSRVQVKSTLSRYQNGFRCNCRASRSRPYKPGAFDFGAILVIPLEAWFIIPNFAMKTCILLNPGKMGSKYYQYEQAWHLLKPPQDLLLAPTEPAVRTASVIAAGFESASAISPGARPFRERNDKFSACDSTALSRPAP